MNAKCTLLLPLAVLVVAPLATSAGDSRVRSIGTCDQCGEPIYSHHRLVRYSGGARYIWVPQYHRHDGVTRPAVAARKEGPNSRQAPVESNEANSEEVERDRKKGHPAPALAG